MIDSKRLARLAQQFIIHPQPFSFPLLTEVGNFGCALLALVRIGDGPTLISFLHISVIMLKTSNAAEQPRYRLKHSRGAVIVH